MSAGAFQEEQRLQTLAGLQILDSPHEAEYDEIVELAAAICGTPISLISLIDRDRQWFKSSKGLDFSETPRDISFCAHAIQKEGLELFVIEDTTEDARFSDNPLVTGEMGIRFYAGCPVLAANGHALGTLCVLDRRPRILTPEQRKALEVLSKQVEARIELRASQIKLEESLQRQEALSASLRDSESLFRTFMNNSPFVSYIKDPDGKMLFYNREFAEVFGLTMNEWIGRPDREVWGEDKADTYRQHDLEVMAAGEKREYLEEALGPGGRKIYYRSLKFPYTDAKGNLLLAGISMDVTEEIDRKAQLAEYQSELEQANRILRELSVTDSLTKLRNRRAFDERLLIEFSTARRKGRDLSVILLDIDDFKKVNDGQGHAAGDKVLKILASLLRSTVRGTDLPARYGGEEFAVLLPECDVPQAVQWAERFRVALREQHIPQGTITVSMGVSGLDAARTPEDLMQRADTALYAAKKAGKNIVVPYESAFHAKADGIGPKE